MGGGLRESRRFMRKRALTNQVPANGGASGISIRNRFADEWRAKSRDDKDARTTASKSFLIMRRFL